MTASPAKILLRPVRIPRYRNQHLVSFSRWMRDNEPSIAEYFHSLPPSADGRDSDFVEFAMAQFHKARTVQERRR